MRIESSHKKTMARRCTFRLLAGILFLSIASATPVSAAKISAETAGPPSSSESTGEWHFVQTPNPHGGADAVSIMHTADTTKSDIDFAGMTIRCRAGGTEPVIILLRPFPLRARLHVVIGNPGNEMNFEATIAPPGTAVLIPTDATTLVGGPWQGQNDLHIRVIDGQSTIRGVVSLTGLQAAFRTLIASCPAQ